MPLALPRPVAPESAAAAERAGRAGRAWPRWLGWRSTPWWGGLFITLVAATAAFDIWRGHAATVAANGVQTVDLVTRNIADEVRAGKLDPLADEAVLHVYLRHQAVGLTQITGLSLIDANGRVRASSSAYPLAADRSGVAEVPAFQQLKTLPSRDLVVAPVMRGVSQPDSWIIPMGRPLQAPDGRFAGAIAAGGSTTSRTSTATCGSSATP